MGDVGKGAAVHEGGCAFQGLHEVWFDGFKQQGHQRARGTEFLTGIGRAVTLDAHNEPVNACAQVFFVRSKANHSHQFARRRDVKTGFGGDAVGGPAQAVNNVTELTVVDVQNALPDHFLEVYLTLVTGVVNQSGQKIVCGRDRVKVSGEMQVD